MKKNYDFSVTLRCPVCGSTDIQVSEDKTYGKCNKCNKEFFGGYDELVELNDNLLNIYQIYEIKYKILNVFKR